LTYAFSGGNAGAAELGKAFGVGAALAPVGGALSILAGPLIRALAQPMIAATGRLSRIQIRGSSAWKKAIVKMSRVFLNTNVKYPAVGSTIFGKLLKKIRPDVKWEQHHVFIQQAWSKRGGPNEVFNSVAASEGLRRIGNGLWNLMPIPRSLNGFLGRNPGATQVFATFYYSLATFGPFHTWRLVTAAEATDI